MNEITVYAICPKFDDFVASARINVEKSGEGDNIEFEDERGLFEDVLWNFGTFPLSMNGLEMEGMIKITVDKFMGKVG